MNAINTHRNQKLTNEMNMEINDMFKILSADYHYQYFPSDKLLTALKALGMHPSAANIIRSKQTEPVDLKELNKIISEHVEGLSHCQAELYEAFRIFDKDDHGYIDPLELKRVFTKITESLTDTEIEDQVLLASRLLLLIVHYAFL